MRILQITPGSGGGFYCQNCLRDLDLVGALRRQGHDVLVMPLYLPLAAHDAPAGAAPVFYGAVGLYLRHRFPALGRLLPARAWRALDAQPLLRYAARRAESTRAAGLSDLTVSMLRGEAGAQADELERLVAWLQADAAARPDVVVLSNALLLGLARRLRAALRVPVLCWLQDEDVWMNAMPASEADAVWQALRARAGDVDTYLSVSATYAATFAPRLGLPADGPCVIPLGVDPARYLPADPARQPPVVGYLARLTPEEGFDVFVEAFIALHADPRWREVRLAATGGLPADARFLAAQRRKLARAGLAARADIDPLRFQQRRPEFLASLSLLSVPAPRGDAGSAYLIEAMAAGVPVVQPRVGAAPELLARAGCGTLYAPHTPQALAAAWAALLADPARRAAEAQRGREAVAREFSLDAAAGRLVAAARAAAATIR